MERSLTLATRTSPGWGKRTRAARLISRRQGRALQMEDKHDLPPPEVPQRHLPPGPRRDEVDSKR